MDIYSASKKKLVSKCRNGLDLFCGSHEEASGMSFNIVMGGEED
jgi:hypothetical protein